MKANRKDLKQVGDKDMDGKLYTVLYQWIVDQMEVLPPQNKFTDNTMDLFTHALITDLIKMPDKKENKSNNT